MSNKERKREQEERKEIEGSGDFLSASVELGNAMVGPKDDAVAAVFSTQMSFDKVVIGPLSSDTRASASVRNPVRNKQKK